YLQLNYNTKIRIQDITSRFHTNRNTLSKRFKEEMGLSVMDYMLRLRIKIACILLRDTNLPITEVMERVGFTDASYWGRAFKRFIGKTPTDYRRG
ncbi:MAG: AraC family transcriptional regulator, partial [Bacillota bacterium]|nr:AraC family transcriptional regulator [Bacillota bacterium]